MNASADHPNAPPVSRRDRFFAGYFWLILKNVAGWILILLSFIAGPLVPGPGGLPLFLIGFALISFPGKRRLTARVLRGKPFRLPPLPFVLIGLGTALAVPAFVLLIMVPRTAWLKEIFTHDPGVAGGVYALAALLTWLFVRLAPPAVNLLLRLIARARRRFRPWLRRHRIRLLPPRWRPRLSHETGAGPYRLKDEILKLYKRRHRN